MGIIEIQKVNEENNILWDVHYNIAVRKNLTDFLLLSKYSEVYGIKYTCDKA